MMLVRTIAMVVMMVVATGCALGSSRRDATPVATATGGTAAVGDTDPSVPLTEVGACPEDHDPGGDNPMPLPMLLRVDPVWMTASGVVAGSAEVVAPFENDPTIHMAVELADPVPLREQVTNPIIGTEAVVSRLVRGESADATLIVGADEDARAAVIVFVTAEGQALFVGPCWERYTRALTAFVATEEPAATPADVLTELVTNPEGALMQRLQRSYDQEPVVPWTDRPAAERLLDIDETPKEVLDTLGVVELVVTGREAWVDVPAILCTRVVELGWNECALFTAAAPGEPLVFLAYVDPEQPLQVVAVAPDRTMMERNERIVAVLGSIPREVLRTAVPKVDPEVRLRLQPPPDDLTTSSSPQDNEPLFTIVPEE